MLPMIVHNSQTKEKREKTNDRNWKEAKNNHRHTKSTQKNEKKNIQSQHRHMFHCVDAGWYFFFHQSFITLSVFLSLSPSESCYVFFLFSYSFYFRICVFFFTLNGTEIFWHLLACITNRFIHIYIRARCAARTLISHGRNKEFLLILFAYVIANGKNRKETK